MIYIVRHGQTEWNKIKRIAGRTDIELNQQGILQAQQIADMFKDVKFDVVISSPLKRTLQTAQIITKTPIVIDERLIERSNGELEGKMVKDVPQDLDFNNENETRFNIENIKDFRKRILSFCNDLTTKYKGKNVLVTTHSGVILYIRCFFEGEPKDNNFNLYKVSNCEILKYEN